MAFVIGVVYRPPNSNVVQFNETLNDIKSIANAFNAYFVNIGPTLAAKIPDLGINYRNFMPQQNNMSFFLSPDDDWEVKKIIAQLKDGAPGKDGIMSKGLNCISDCHFHMVCFPMN